MKTIQLSGRITEMGQLELRLPEGLPSGEARITIEISQSEDWRPEDVEAALKVEPLTGAEIVEAGLLGGWEEQGISNSDAWLEEQRRQRRGQRSW
jgi:hypothetical protein